MLSSHQKNPLAQMTGEGDTVEAAESDRFSHSRPREAKTTIVLIERRVLARDCFARSLQSAAGSDEVLAFASVQEWQEASQPGASPVIIFSIGGNRIEDEETSHALALLSKEAGTSPVVLLSDVEDIQEIRKALECGIRGFIPTTVSLNVAIEAIRLVRAGGIYLPFSSLLSQQWPNGGALASNDRRSGDNFTARQMAVLRAVREGKANKVIAHQLNMNESTVKVHVRNIMKKLNAKNRTEVAYKTNKMFGNIGSSATL